MEMRMGNDVDAEIFESVTIAFTAVSCHYCRCWYFPEKSTDRYCNRVRTAP